MPKPITPLTGCDTFVTDSENRVLLIRRTDNGLWALPGGCQNLGETPAACAIRECEEETGYIVQLDSLLGVWSSLSYEFVHYPWKDNEFVHVLFRAHIVGGSIKTSDESSAVEWFGEHELPPLSDGHSIRIGFGFNALGSKIVVPYFE